MARSLADTIRAALAKGNPDKLRKALEKWDDLPEQVKKEIAANYPEYKEPPPSTDTRPNETSWTYFKKKVKPDAPAPRRFD